MRMTGSFMKEAFPFNGCPDIVGIYSDFIGFSIPEALKQDIDSNRVGNKLGYKLSEAGKSKILDVLDCTGNGDIDTSTAANTDSDDHPRRRLGHPRWQNLVRELRCHVQTRAFFSPKALRCSSRWEELLKLEKLYQSKGKYGPAFMNLWKSLLSSHRLMHLASVDQFSAEFYSFISICIQKGPDDRKISTMGLPAGAPCRSHMLLVCPSLYLYLLTRM